MRTRRVFVLHALPLAQHRGDKQGLWEGIWWQGQHELEHTFRII